MKNFNVIFDLKTIETDFFAFDDEIRANKLYNALRQLKIVNNKAYEQCRFILSAPVDVEIKSPQSDVQFYLSNSQSQPQPPQIPFELEIFCLSKFKDLLQFNYDFGTVYNHFLNVSSALHLIYYQKSKLNNMKILFSNNGHQNIISGPKIPAYHSIVGYLVYNEKGISITDSKVCYFYS